jgi:hypothetical protein
MPLDNAGMPEHDDPFAKYNTDASPILFPVAERKVGWERRDGGWERVNSHKAIIRIAQDGRPHVLSVVGANYRLIHNRELYSFVEDTMRKEMQPSELDGVQVKDKVAGWGRTCFREYVFPNIKCILGGSTKSEIAFRLLVQNGYGGSALRMHAGAIEFYCTNGMISGEYESTYRKHTSGLYVSGIAPTVHKALATFSYSQSIWKRWATTPVHHQAAMDLFRELASSEKLRENLQDQYLRERDARGDTLWSVYSAMTYYASHADGGFALRRTVEQQDTQASVMLNRELSVAKWIESDAWKKLESVER